MFLFCTQTVQKELESKYGKVRQLERQIDQLEADQDEKVGEACTHFF